MEGSRYDDRRGDPGEGPHAAAGKAACGAGLYRVPAVTHAGERAAQTPTGALEGSGRLDYRRRHLRSAAGDVGQLSAGRRLKPGWLLLSTRRLGISPTIRRSPCAPRPLSTP